MPVCPVVAAFEERLTASLDAATRTRLLAPLDFRLADSRGSRQVEVRRAFLAADWIVRTYVPRWLRAAGLDTAASDLEALAPLTDAESFNVASVELARICADVEAWRVTQGAEPVEMTWDQRDGSNAAWMALREASKGTTQSPFSVAAIAEAALVLERAWVAGWRAAQVVRSRDIDAMWDVVEQHRVSAATLFQAMLDTTTVEG